MLATTFPGVLRLRAGGAYVVLAARRKGCEPGIQGILSSMKCSKIEGATHLPGNIQTPGSAQGWQRHLQRLDRERGRFLRQDSGVDPSFAIGYRGQLSRFAKAGAGGRNRTDETCLEGRSFTTKLRPRGAGGQLLLPTQAVKPAPSKHRATLAHPDPVIRPGASFPACETFAENGTAPENNQFYCLQGSCVPATIPVAFPIFLFLVPSPSRESKRRLGGRSAVAPSLRHEPRWNASEPA